MKRTYKHIVAVVLSLILIASFFVLPAAAMDATGTGFFGNVIDDKCFYERAVKLPNGDLLATWCREFPIKTNWSGMKSYIFFKSSDNGSSWLPYHADRMGLLVWGEIGAAYLYSEQYADRIYREWLDVLRRDYNHPCIVVWTPLNESWGVQEIETDPRQQAHSEAMVAITKSMDTTRLVVDNDGWEHTNGDLLTIHDYSPSGEMLRAHLGSMDAILALRPAQRALFVGRHAYAGQPILLSEFGGVKFVPGTEAQHSWGYCEADSCAAFAGKLRELFDAVRACPLVDGYCYTQLTDVETEQNGLLTYDRTPKLPLETICAILNGRTNEHENL